jgi:DNA-binding transcriptional LysR family regulator
MLSNDRMQQFCAVLETGSLHQAGAMLRLTPGTLSRSISKLKDELGFELFQIQGRSLVPTPKAKHLYSIFRKSLDQLQSELLQLQAGQPSLPTETLKLGTFELFSTHVMAEIVEAAFEPATNILLRELVPGQMEAALLQHEIDIAITNAPHLESGIHFDRIGQSPVHVYGLKGRFARVAATEIPFAVPITPMGRNAVQMATLDGWNPKHPRFAPYKFEMLETALQFAKKGRCVVALPKFIGSNPNIGLTPHPAFEVKYKLAPQEVYLARRKQDPESANYKKLAARLRVLMKG